MIFTQFVDDALGCASYLVGDPGTGQAVVVDPAFAIEQYLEDAERQEVRIVRVVEMIFVMRRMFGLVDHEVLKPRPGSGLLHLPRMKGMLRHA